MEAGLDTTVRSLEWIVGLIDARAPEPISTSDLPQPRAGFKLRLYPLLFFLVVGGIYVTSVFGREAERSGPRHHVTAARRAGNPSHE